jgi:hypothetical protein
MAYLTGFEPRFEEALLLLVGDKPLVLITGPENHSYARISPIELELVVFPPFGLLGQDRRTTPALADLLAAHGITRGMDVGVAGWKYFGPSEAPTPDAWLETPSFIVDTLRAITGTGGRVVNAMRLLMGSSEGLRAVNEIDQLAQFEFSACHASEAIKRVLINVWRFPKGSLRFGERTRTMQSLQVSAVTGLICSDTTKHGRNQMLRFSSERVPRRSLIRS